jgi:hypothetical protein
MLARAIVFDSESVERFLELIGELCENFNPANEVEMALVEKMAASRWRQQRLWGIEKSTFALEERNQLAAYPTLASEDAPSPTIPARFTCSSLRNLLGSPVQSRPHPPPRIAGKK